MGDTVSGLGEVKREMSVPVVGLMEMAEGIDGLGSRMRLTHDVVSAKND